jgi:translation initiation factor 3 subunit G
MTAEPTTNRWGDDEDEFDSSSKASLLKSQEQQQQQQLVSIPPTHTSRVDSKGIKLVTSYRANPSNPSSLLKTVTKIRVHKVTATEHVSVAKRRTWKKFGQAAIDQVENNTNVTIQSRDDIYLEDPNADTDLQEEDVTKALAGNLNEFWAKQQRRHLERKYDVDSTNATSATGTSAGQEESGDGGWQKVGKDGGVGGAAGSGGASTGKYVPPSARGGGGATVASSSASSSARGGLAALANRIDKAGGPTQPDRDQNTIRVTNISEETTEADLQQLFQKFGRISRVYLAKDKETLQSRGFAFVSFVHVQDAAMAMEKLQGYGFDHLILKLEWARPSAPKNPATEGTEYRSGYGKALAQDTKEKVSYASNLTTGTGR